jgi:hypothetical protein
MPFGSQTYTDGSRRESLLSILKDVSPNTDNYLVSNLGKAPAASNTLHEWVTYYTARPTSVTNVIEGAAASYGDLASPIRTSNITAIVSEPVRVSGTEMAISTATGEDPYAFQKAEALKRMKANMEYLTLNGVRASGASGVARGLTGIDGMISTNVTARTSGQSFTEAELNDIMQQSWDAVGGDYVADLLLCPMVIKRRISGFSTNLTRNINASEKRLSQDIRVYDSEVGKTVMIIPHKDVRAAAGTLTVYALREETWKHAFLVGREPSYEELAKDGDRKNGQYLTEFTVVGYAQPASVKRTGYATTL